MRTSLLKLFLFQRVCIKGEFPMKRLISLVLCIALSSLAACNQETVQTHTSTKTSKNNATAETREAQAQVTTTRKASDKTNEFAKFIKEAPKLSEKKELKMQELVAKELVYTSYLGLRKTFPNTLPMPLAYENEKIYYMSQRVPDDMSQADLENAIKNSQVGPEKHYFGYYDVKKGEKHEIMVDDWHVMLADYATQVLPNNKLLVIYVSNGKNVKNSNIDTKIVVLDLDKQTQTTIAEYATFNALSAVKKLNDNEYAMLLTIVTDEKQNKTQQILLHFDSTKNQIKEIYRGETMSEKSKDVFAFDCYDGKIYLLMHKLNNGKLNTFLCTIDKEGKELTDVELTALAKYESPEQLVEDLYVEKDFLFVQFEGKGRAPEANNEPIVMLRRIGDNYELQNLSDMQIINIPQVHRQATEALVMPKYMLDENTETYQYYAFSPENNTFDIWDTKSKREDGSHRALNIANQKLFVFASDQESNYKYFIATPDK